MRCPTDQYLPVALDPCGSWLASDDGLTANQPKAVCPQFNCGSEPARESGLPSDQYLPVALDPCGSWLASDDGLTANQPATDRPQPNCGSEPARESGLPVTTTLTDPPRSRAGSLPHLIGDRQIIATTQSPADTAQPPAPSADSNESPTPTDPPADSRSAAAIPYPPPKPAPAHHSPHSTLQPHSQAPATDGDCAPQPPPDTTYPP